MFTTLDHVIVAVRDLAVATETYSRLLGRRASWRGQHAQLGTANTLFRMENIYLELLTPAGHSPIAERLAQHLERNGEGLFGLAFGTQDAAGCAVALRARGVAATDPVEGDGQERRSGARRAWRNVYIPEAATRGVILFGIEHQSSPDVLPAAEPLAPADGIVTGLDHVVIMSEDADATRGLYGDQLGLRLALDRRFEERGVRLLFFRIGGVTVEVAGRLDASPEASATDRLWGLAYQVGDAPAARARLVDAGFDVSDVRPGNKPGTRVCTVRRETHGVSTLLIGPA